jgi:hypothetical protein
MMGLPRIWEAHLNPHIAATRPAHIGTYGRPYCRLCALADQELRQSSSGETVAVFAARRFSPIFLVLRLWLSLPYWVTAWRASDT